ncbi:hypothetical protein RB213_004794 [Colletotrichum asianum]
MLDKPIRNLKKTLRETLTSRKSKNSRENSTPFTPLLILSPPLLEDTSKDLKTPSAYSSKTLTRNNRLSATSHSCNTKEYATTFRQLSIQLDLTKETKIFIFY